MKKIFTNAIQTATALMVDAIRQFVNAEGEELGQYEIDAFGIDPEDYEGKITKVFDIWNDAGCNFAMQHNSNIGAIDDLCEQDKEHQAVRDYFTHYVFQAFYIVRYPDGREEVFSSAMESDGICYDDMCLPNHSNMSLLPLPIISMIVETINTRLQ